MNIKDIEQVICTLEADNNPADKILIEFYRLALHECIARYYNHNQGVQ